MKTPEVGVAIIIWKDGKLLVGKRKKWERPWYRRFFGRKGGSRAGYWSLPGGHLEPGEGFEDGCRREIREEVGIEVGPIFRFMFVNDIVEEEDLHYVQLFFVTTYLDGEVRNPEPDKCEGWEWRSPDDMPSPLTPPLEEVMKILPPITLGPGG